MPTIRRTPRRTLRAPLLRAVILLALAASLLLVSCGLPSRGLVIDWADFIHLNGIGYDRASPPVTIDESALGPEYARVEFNVSENVNTLGYRLKHGDAAYLDVGTPIYEITGYAPTFRLAAFRDDRLLVYEADSNPAATTGADMFDIEGKVASISINSETDGTTPLAAIDNPDQVAALVALLLAAPIDHDLPLVDGPRYFIAFHLADGTQVTHVYWSDTRAFHRGIMLPPEFATAIEQALAAP